MTNYEIMFIVRPDLEKEATAKVAKDFEKVLTDNKANILSSKEIGGQELAYEIKGHKTGYYYLVNVEASNASDYVKGIRSWNVSVYSNSNQTDQLFSGYVNSFSNYANHVLNVYVGQFTSSSPLYSCYIYVGDNYVYLLNDGAWNSVSNYYGTIYTN